MKTLDRSFDKTVGPLEPKVRKTFSCYPLFQIFQFFFKCIFFTKFVLDTCCSVLTFLSQNPLRYKPRKLPPSVRKWVVFFHRKFSNEIFPLACKVQFWELSRNFYVEFLESFTELPHKKNKVLQKTFLHGMFHWTQRMLFWQPCRKLLAIYPKCFSPQSEIQFKKLFFKEKASQENNPAET